MRVNGMNVEDGAGRWGRWLMGRGKCGNPLWVSQLLWHGRKNQPADLPTTIQAAARGGFTLA